MKKAVCVVGAPLDRGCHPLRGDYIYPRIDRPDFVCPAAVRPEA